MYCQNCGTQLEENAKFCQSCGAAQSSVEVSGEPVQKQSKKGTVLLISVIAAVGLVLLIGLFSTVMIYQRKANQTIRSWMDKYEQDDKDYEDEDNNDDTVHFDFDGSEQEF